MALRIFSIQHHRHGLSEVERVSAQADALATAVLQIEGVTGAMVLNTCNRVEVLLDTDREVANQQLRLALNSRFTTPPAWDLLLGEAALGHLFRVAAGLDSMVVGEREVAGQLRRALHEAQTAGQICLPLSIVVEEALKTSRRIARDTGLESAGRSIVSSGLDLAGLPAAADTRVLIVGTGSYAGAVVAALRARGVTRLAVHSASGRGAAFAASHEVDDAPELATALNEAQLVVTCRGLGNPIVTPKLVAGPLVLLDLSLRRDVASEVSSLPGVRVVDLAAIQSCLGSHIEEDTRRARAMVNEGIAEALTKLRARVVDPAVVSLREAVMDLVEEEVSRLPNRALSHDDAALALRRLATRLLHIPSARARLAAEQDRTDEYLTAVAELYGLPVRLSANDLDSVSCPVTQLSVHDLAPSEVKEAI